MTDYTVEYEYSETVALSGDTEWELEDAANAHVRSGEDVERVNVVGDLLAGGRTDCEITVTGSEYVSGADSRDDARRQAESRIPAKASITTITGI